MRGGVRVRVWGCVAGVGVGVRESGLARACVCVVWMCYSVFILLCMLYNVHPCVSIFDSTHTHPYKGMGVCRCTETSNRFGIRILATYMQTKSTKTITLCTLL